jgi:hypothetical protein
MLPEACYWAVKRIRRIKQAGWLKITGYQLKYEQNVVMAG